MREFSLALDARPTEVTAIAIAIAFHEGFRRMGRHEDFPGFVKSAANILAPVHWDLGHVDEHYFPIRDFRVFGPRPRIEVRTIALAMLWPVAWIVYILIYGAITKWYPYPSST